MDLPGFRCLCGGFDTGIVIFTDVADAVGNPVNILLDTERNVADVGGIVGADALYAHERVRTIRPFVCDRSSGVSTNSDPGQRSSHCISSRGKNVYI